MATLRELEKKYHKIVAPLDLELIFSLVLKKSREFILAHPESKISRNHESRITSYARRRIKGEPMAYLLGHKEFYGLDFKVDKNTLIPRPETELLVELALKHISTVKRSDNLAIVDVGTGSGNIIISLAQNIEHGTLNKLSAYGLDISSKALVIAKSNARKYKLDKKIKFLQGSLLTPIIKRCSLLPPPCSLIILANLPYLSSEIYRSASKEVRSYEPRSALFSANGGLDHYRKLLKQLASLANKKSKIKILLEISPEQKKLLTRIIKTTLPGAIVTFHKDLAHKWRVGQIDY